MTGSTDWRAVVAQYSSKGAAQAAAVQEATQRAEELMGTPDFWEAVYTLAQQSVQMADARGES